MPRLDSQAVGRELDAGMVRPFYWLYGAERMIARELLARIRKVVLGAEDFGMAEECFDGQEADVSQIIDAAQSLCFGGGPRFIVVREAHALKSSETLESLLIAAGPVPRDKTDFVCVCISKDLDGRKKFSKVLVDKAVVVACEEVLESDRESWIQYLAKRRGLTFPAQFLPVLVTLDPWSLDIVDQELEKFEISGGKDGDVFLPGGELQSTDAALEAFFSRNLARALVSTEQIAGRPEEALPLLGLLSWNVRQLALLVQDQKLGTRNAKFSPHFADRFRAWAKLWTLQDLLRLQEALAELDFNFKQKPLLPLGLWSSLAIEFCH